MIMERSQEHQILYKIAEVTLSYKSRHKISECPIINCSEKAYEIWLQYWNLDQIDFVEHFKVMLLNRANWVIGISDISTGGVSGTVADPKVIFVIALKAKCQFYHPGPTIIPPVTSIPVSRIFS
jgi:DNA repair protein RadC